MTGPHGDELRKRLAGQTRLLLVDEFQDTDPLQVELVKALCDGRFTDGKLFFVGDKKQSIYRFRGADPHVFRQLRRGDSRGRPAAAVVELPQPAGRAGVRQHALRRGVEGAGEEYEPLRAFRAQVGPRPAVEFLWAVEPEEEARPARGEAGERPDVAAAERLRRREADWIARRLRGMLDAGEKIVWEKREGRRRPAVRGRATSPCCSAP